MRQILTFVARGVVLGLALLATERPMAAACTPLPVASPQGNGGGQFIAVAGGGRYVAFGSYASDLVPGDTVANDFDAFRLDLQTCTVVRAAKTSTGGEANARIYGLSISDDGRYIAFYTAASNVVPGDANGVYDAFVRDLQADTTVRASVSAGGGDGNGHSTVPAISGNGQFVAFWSEASNIVANDTNGEMDVFVRDLVNDTTTRVSVATGGGQGSGGPGGEGTEFFTPSLALSNDGRFVFFSSAKTNLVPGDTNGVRDLFRHDRQTGTTIRVSLRADGSQSTSEAFGPSASADGQYVSFTTGGELVTADTNGTTDVYLRNIALGITTRASVTGYQGELPAGATNGSLSGDARYIAFESLEHRIVPGDTNNAVDVFVHDRLTGVTRRASRSAAGVQGNSSSSWASLSEDGLVLGYFSNASNLVANSLNTQDVFITTWQTLPAPASPERMVNGDFASGLTSWSTFGLPNPTDVVATVTSGALEFYRKAGAQQAVVFQTTSGGLLADAPLIAHFDLGNSSNARKRVSVLIHDADFHDLHVCTFWLPANAPLQTYGMRTHTTSTWSGATISFYAANADGAAAHLVDNVSLVWDPDAPILRTDCLDATAPAAPGGLASSNLLTNGDFSGGQAAWGTYGSITSQISGGAFEFFRPGQIPSGVVLQSTGQALSDAEIVTASLSLGNSSSVRKRMTLLLHDSNFTSLSACTFWLAPEAPLQSYAMRTFAAGAWANATFSLYAATVDSLGWIRFDDATLQRTPGAAALGTECFEPTSTVSADAALVAPRTPPSGPQMAGVVAPITSSEIVAWKPSGGFEQVLGSESAGWVVRSTEQATHVLHSSVPIDLRDAKGAWLSFRSRLLALRSSAEIQVRAGDTDWVTLFVVPPSEDWQTFDVNLAAYVGQVVELQFVYDAVASLDGATSEEWHLINPEVEVVAGDVLPI